MSDPFAHLPKLRDRIRPAAQSELRFTPDVLAVWDERARKMGRPASWRLSDREIEASRDAVLGRLDISAGLWIYGYGSLMWDPGFHFSEVRLADLTGHQRRFNFRTTIARGTEELPALMLSLEAGPGCCQGLAFHVAAGSADSESAILWRREMIRGGYSPAMLPVNTPQGQISALVFANNATHPDYAGNLSLADAAAIIARASGLLGTNRDYLEMVARQLDTLDIQDAYVAQLLQLVREIGDA